MTTLIPKLAIGISFYNDAECLKRCLKSIDTKYVHRVIGVDGKYKGFDKSRDSKLSDDGSREIMAEWGDKHSGKLAMSYCAGVPEYSKRQMYVDIAAWCGAEFLLILDSDEYLYTQWIKLVEQLAFVKEQRKERGMIGKIDMMDINPDEGLPSLHSRPRLWYRPEQFFYDGRHNKIARKNGEPVGENFFIRRDVIEIDHHKQSCRSEYRQEQQQDYEYRLEALEKSNTSHV